MALYLPPVLSSWCLSSCPHHRHPSSHHQLSPNWSQLHPLVSELQVLVLLLLLCQMVFKHQKKKKVTQSSPSGKSSFVKTLLLYLLSGKIIPLVTFLSWLKWGFYQPITIFVLFFLFSPLTCPAWQIWHAVWEDWVPCGAKTKKKALQRTSVIRSSCRSLYWNLLARPLDRKQEKRGWGRQRGGENTENNDNYSDNPDSKINSSHNITFGVALPLSIMKTYSIFKGRFVISCGW